MSSRYEGGGHGAAAAAAAAGAGAGGGVKEGGGRDAHEDDLVMPGFRLHPMEEELIEFYLRRKVEGKRFNVELITFLDLTTLRSGMHAGAGPPVAVGGACTCVDCLEAATAGTGSGKGKAMSGGNGKRAGGSGPGGGSKAVGGAVGWGGASTFSAAEHSTFETVSWQTYRSLTITRSSTAATAGKGVGKGVGGGNAKRSGATKGVGASGRGGAKGAGGAGGDGWGGAPTFATIGYMALQTDTNATNEYYGCSSEHGALFSPTAHGSFETDHSTFETATQTMNEHYDEEEHLGLTMDYKEDGMQDPELVTDADAEGDDGSGGGGHDDAGVDYYDDVGAGSDHFGDDDYYDDNVAGGFDDGYDPGDAGDGAADWW
ncbi:NAC transcription factor [Hordeum vulgare]|nr:NAC transcription factor [Hordeum vulgare]